MFKNCHQSLALTTPTAIRTRPLCVVFSLYWPKKRLVNLDDNMVVQEGGFILLLLCMLAWTVQFFYSGINVSNVPVNDFSGYGQVRIVIADVGVLCIACAT